tara:strand:+ start:622 stop:1434 length:813 start_codon:yes stop_codon:yes gene_type:complete
MATVNLGRIKPVFRGAYNNSTAYVIDDIVTSGNETFIAIAATQGNATSDASKWTKLAAKGADGTDVAAILANKEIAFKTNAGALDGIPIGTAGQALKVNSGATGYEFGTISSGTYSVHAHDEYSYASNSSHSSVGDYFDIAGGNTVNFTVTHVDDLVAFNYRNAVYFNNNANGCDIYLMMKAGSASIGSGDTKLDFNGQHSFYFSQESSHHTTISKSFILKCTGLTVGTTYYVEMCAGKHNSETINFNNSNTNTQSHPRHFVQMIHYKKN